MRMPSTFKDITFAQGIMVIGFGRVGKLITKYLSEKKNYVYIYDDNPKVFQKKEAKKIIKKPYCLILTKEAIPSIISKIKFAICSPGISDENKVVKLLQNKKIPIIDEIEFTASLIKKIIIAITGTNGKSTTTVLIGKILENANKKVFYGGNLAPGQPFIQALFQKSKDYYVIELSSFQLERCFSFHPQIAILLNITADHLNRHKTLSKYRGIKFRIFANQTPKDYAIINYDDKTIMRFKNRIPSCIVGFSKEKIIDGAYQHCDSLYFNKERICSISDIKLSGNHYWESVLAAITVAKILKINNKLIIKTLRNFRGLEHRLEFVREINQVKYINNSMCTNPFAAIASLYSFAEPVILITGGCEKKLDISNYIHAITKKVKWVILFGENRVRLAKMLRQNQYRNYQIADSLKQSVFLAQKQAQPGDIILFSPGFASFDAFTDFQERGRVFKAIVKNRLN